MADRTRHQAAIRDRDERLRAAAVAFGQNLRRWRRRNGWAQDTAQDWGLAAGIPRVFASQWSQLETGSMKAPSPGLFWNLGHQNGMLAMQCFGAVTDRALLDRLNGAEAVRHDDGDPWDAADFFAAYIGLLDWPPLVEPEPPTITDDDAAAWSETLRELFRRTAQEAGLDPLTAVVAAMQHSDPENEGRLGYQRLLLGFEGLTVEQLLEQWREREPGPLEWLTAWRRSLGLNGTPPAPPWEGKGSAVTVCETVP